LTEILTSQTDDLSTAGQRTLEYLLKVLEAYEPDNEDDLEIEDGEEEDDE
jgi:hypothetical protein